MLVGNDGESFARFLIYPNDKVGSGESRATLEEAVTRGDALVASDVIEFFTIARVEHGAEAFGSRAPVLVYDSRVANTPIPPG